MMMPDFPKFYHGHRSDHVKEYFAFRKTILFVLLLYTVYDFLEFHFVDTCSLTPKVTQQRYVFDKILNKCFLCFNLIGQFSIITAKHSLIPTYFHIEFI